MADCDNCRDGDCPRCDIFVCGCLHKKEDPGAGKRSCLDNGSARLLGLDTAYHSGGSDDA